MPGIEFERASFEVSERVAEVLNGISDARLKNSLLSVCGRDLANANLIGRHCDIRGLIITAENIGGSIRYLADYWRKAYRENDTKVLGDLQEALANDMSEILFNDCGCKRE